MVAPSRRQLATRTGEVRWMVRIRPAVHEADVIQSRRFISWCDELMGVRLTCPRCGRTKAVLRRWRPVGCRAIYWLLCLSVSDRRSNVMSEEVVRQLLTEAIGADVALQALGVGPGPTR